MRIDYKAWLLNEPHPQARRPNLVIYSSCHTWSFLTYLRDFRDDVARLYNVTGVVVHLAHAAGAASSDHFRQAFESADVILYHPLDSDKYKTVDGHAYRIADMKLKPGVRLFSMASPQASCFWPILADFAPAADATEQLLDKGLTADEIIDAFEKGWMNHNFSARLQDDLGRMLARDVGMDIRSADYVVRNWPAVKMFSTNNHPTFHVYGYIMERLIHELGHEAHLSDEYANNLPTSVLEPGENHFPETKWEWRTLGLQYPMRYTERGNYPDFAREFYRAEIRKIAARRTGA